MLNAQSDIMMGGKPLFQGQKPALPKPEAAETAGLRSESAIKWVVENENGSIKLKPLANTADVDVTTVSIYQEEVESPRLLRFMGHKIDITAKVAEFKENYVKNFMLTKSHNLMVARFAEFKTAFLGYLLSLCGVASEDIKKLQEKAVKDGIRQNNLLFEENEYNNELLSLIGGSKKQMRAQQKVAGEIRNQLIIQAKNLGLSNHYTQEKILEIQLSQCQKILQKFQEEKFNLEYQLAYLGVEKSVN